MLAGLIALVGIAVIFFAGYRISRRMGFGSGASLLLGVATVFGLSVILWWVLDWPNETA